MEFVRFCDQPAGSRAHREILCCPAGRDHLAGAGMPALPIYKLIPRQKEPDRSTYSHPLQIRLLDEFVESDRFAFFFLWNSLDFAAIRRRYPESSEQRDQLA